jgi:hypothetical protein
MLITRFAVVALAACFSAPDLLALEDPTRPPDAGSEPAGSPDRRAYSLNSILIGPDRRAVVIDGITRVEGERFGGATVVSIQTDRVVLNDGGQTRTLHWKMPPRVRSSK